MGIKRARPGDASERPAARKQAPTSDSVVVVLSGSSSESEASFHSSDSDSDCSELSSSSSVVETLITKGSSNKSNRGKSRPHRTPAALDHVVADPRREAAKKLLHELEKNNSNTFGRKSNEPPSWLKSLMIQPSARPSFLAPWQHVSLSVFHQLSEQQIHHKNIKLDSNVLQREVTKFHVEQKQREDKLRRSQRSSRATVVKSVFASVQKAWNKSGAVYGKLLRSDFEQKKREIDRDRQDELLKESEELTARLLNSIVQERKRQLARTASATTTTAATTTRSSVADKEQPPSSPHVADSFEHLLTAPTAVDVQIEQRLQLLDTQDGARPLREYQRSALQWMINLYEGGLNGILADEMGLGKTVQTLALFAYYAEFKNDWGPHLVVVPTTVVLNWKAECARWCPGLKVLTYIGNAKERAKLRSGWTLDDSFHVCITTYNLTVVDRKVFRRRPWGFLVLDEAHHIKNFASLKWQSLFDIQAQHRLLLTGTPLQNSVMELWALFHFLLPFSSLFESDDEFREWYSNPMDAMVTGKIELEETVVRRLQAMLRPFLLRRLKRDVEKQLPSKTERLVLCRLSRRQRTLYDDYMQLTETRNTIRGNSAVGGMFGVLLALRKVCNHPDLFVERPTRSPWMIATCPPWNGILCAVPRRVCIALHPTYRSRSIVTLLDRCVVEDVALPLPSSSRPTTASLDESDWIPSSLFCGSLFDYASQFGVGSGGAQFPSTSAWDAASSDHHSSISKYRPPPIEDPETMPPGLRWLRNILAAEAASSIAETRRRVQWCARQNERHRLLHAIVQGTYFAELGSAVALCDMGWNDWSDVACRKRNYRAEQKQQLQQKSDVLIPTRSGRAQRRTVLTAADAACRPPSWFLCDQRPLSALQRATLLFPSMFPSFYERMTHPATVQLIQRVAVYVPKVRCYEGPSLQCALPVEQWRSRFQAIHLDQLGPLRQLHDARRGNASDLFGDEMWPSQARQAFNFPDKRLLIHDCGKFQFLEPLLKQLRREGHRALIFSQFNGMLNLLEQFVSLLGFTYLRIDGSTPAEVRQRRVDLFNHNPVITLMILSTRSGGIGLNLTGADTVIFFDSDWNPTVDLQAQDRCHRIGQTRPVTIYRLVSEHTVEERIVAKAQERKLLNNVVIRGGQFHAIADAAAGGAGNSVGGQGSEEVADGGESTYAPLDFSRVNLRSFFHDLDEDATVVPEGMNARAAPLSHKSSGTMSTDGAPEDIQRAMREAEDAEDQLALQNVCAELDSLHHTEASDEAFFAAFMDQGAVASTSSSALDRRDSRSLELLTTTRKGEMSGDFPRRKQEILRNAHFAYDVQRHMTLSYNITNGAAAKRQLVTLESAFNLSLQ